MASPVAQATVLVVDDDEEQRIGVSGMVSVMGYIAETAPDGEQALEKLGSTPVDVIITDLMMPRMDGFQLLRTLLERGDLTPAIVLTAFGSIDQAISIVHDLRAFWFLEKPVQPGVLGTFLERAVRHKSLVKETERLRRQLGYQGYLMDLVGTSPPMRQIYSVMKRARSPMHWNGARAVSNRRMEALCSSTKSGKCQSALKPSCCVFLKKRKYGVWAGQMRFRPTSVSSPRPIGHSKQPSKRNCCARIFTTG